MKAELKSYIEECNCPEIQNWLIKELNTNRKWNCEYTIPISDWEKVWKIDGSKSEPEILNTAIEYHYPSLDFRDLDKIKKGVIFLPSLDQLFEMMGGRFDGLNPLLDSTFQCFAVTKLTPPFSHVLGVGDTPKLACIRAYKEIRNENKEKK